ncbi:MAG: hypothetical protein ACYCOY_11390 [Metallibacterium sp.]
MADYTWLQDQVDRGRCSASAAGTTENFFATNPKRHRAWSPVLPIVSALDDVLRNTGKVESGLAGHDARDVEWGVQACCLEGQVSVGKSRKRVAETAL